MDPVRQGQWSFDNLPIDEINYTDGAYWIEVAWSCEDTADISWDRKGRGRDSVGVRYVKVHQEEEDLSDLADSTLAMLTGEEGSESTLVRTESKVSALKTQTLAAQRSRQSTRSKDNRFVAKQENYRTSISRKPYKCHLGCDTPAFKWPKDLRRYVEDIHETRARYRCTVAGNKCGEDRVCHSIKRKDNFRRYLQKKHNVDIADLLDLDLDRFFVVV